MLLQITMDSTPNLETKEREDDFLILLEVMNWIIVLGIKLMIRFNCLPTSFCPSKFITQTFIDWNIGLHRPFVMLLFSPFNLLVKLLKRFTYFAELNLHVGYAFGSIRRIHFFSPLHLETTTTVSSPNSHMEKHYLTATVFH